MLEKLSCYGIQNNKLNWSTDNLFLRKKIVQFKGVLSEANLVFTGVPQGSILWPLLFSIHFNDIHKPLCYSNIITYADDSVILTSSKDLDGIQHNLGEDTNSLASWFRDNKLTINLKKRKNWGNAVWNSKKIKQIRWQRTSWLMHLVSTQHQVTSTSTYIWTPHWILIRTFTRHTRTQQEEWTYNSESILTLTPLALNESTEQW